MVVLKCKMCGGTLDVQEGMTVCECEYCGSKQTVPAVDNEKKIKLFGRANRLRIDCEFDKAGSVYESIIKEFPEEAEGYWGKLLCKYGIEYVDDPATGDKVTACHRASFESVMDDEDFEMVMENADSVSRSVYREQAKQIEVLRKGIMAVSSKEAPYDIFICYKETDENGDRTIDSVIAQDVYDALTGKGYRVFFSRISLEDKLETEYEPYIFAALNSAKVMLAFGTSYDYYNAVWVKNEWSRFLKLMKNDKTKHLIPCYKDIDAYDIPKEFAKLQAQDMGKARAPEDLLRRIDKIFGKVEEREFHELPQATQRLLAEGAKAETPLKSGNEVLEDGASDKVKGVFISKEPAKPQAQVMEKARTSQDLPRETDKISGKDEKQKVQGQPQVNRRVVTGGTKVKALLNRGYDALEDGAFKEARRFFNNALNKDPKSAAAYLGLYMVDTQSEDLITAKSNFVTGCYAVFYDIDTPDDEHGQEERYWKRARQYAKGDLADELLSWENERDTYQKNEAARQEEDLRSYQEELKRKEAKRKAELADVDSQLEAIKAGIYVLGPEEEKELEKLKKEAEEARKAAEQAESELKDMPEQAKVQLIVLEIAAKRSQISGLGFFRRKEKQSLQDQVSALEQSERLLRSSIKNKAMAVSQLKNEYQVAQAKAESYKEQVLGYAYERLQARKRCLTIYTSNSYLRAGEVVYFGRYEHGDGVRPIAWKVLKVEFSYNLLLIAVDAIDCKQYNKTNPITWDITWADCYLREWLNHEFLEKAFSEEEKAMIREERVNADKNPKYDTKAGNGSTIDKIFLLSIPEAEKYMLSDKQRICFPTAYAVKQGAYKDKNTGACKWWLRSPGHKSDSAAFVNLDGSVNYYGDPIDRFHYCVRPALWINTY